MRHDFCDGKYTVINEPGKLTALRNGEPWGRDLVGDNLVYWMLVEVDRLKEELTKANALSVTSILLDVVPGYEGEGLEVYAKSVDDVEGTLTKLGEQIEDLQSRLATSLAPASVPTVHAVLAELGFRDVGSWDALKPEALIAATVSLVNKAAPVAPATTPPAQAANRYCRAGMCVATDAAHEPGCNAHNHAPVAPLSDRALRTLLIDAALQVAAAKGVNVDPTQPDEDQLALAMWAVRAYEKARQ